MTVSKQWANEESSEVGRTLQASFYNNKVDMTTVLIDNNMSKKPLFLGSVFFSTKISCV